MLVWKALKRALPVGSRLVERHINVQPIWKRCGNDESILRLFFQCSFAHEVWPLAPATSTIDYSGGIDFPDHWNAVRETVPPCGITWKSIAPWIIWALWTSRNKLVFNERTLSPVEVMSTTIETAREWQNSQLMVAGKQRKTELPPQNPVDQILVRSDAAWKESSTTTGLGWTISERSGLSTFSSTEAHIFSPLIAESQLCEQLFSNVRNSESTKSGVNRIPKSWFPASRRRPLGHTFLDLYPTYWVWQQNVIRSRLIGSNERKILLLII